MARTDHAALYRGVRVRVSALVRDLPSDMLDRTAPATPEWRVRDIVAHLAGAMADVTSGNLEDVASDAWTRAQVEARRDTPVTDLLEEWERCSEVVEPQLSSFPPVMRAMALTDAVTHEHDIRGALGQPGQRDADAVAYAFNGIARGLGAAHDAAMRIVHDDGVTVVGSGAVVATVRTSRFEIVRAGVGRRSIDQIAAWEWDGDVRPEAMVLGRFSPPRATPLDE